MTIDKFVDKHGGYWDGECPEWPLSLWRFEVVNNDTRLGYWEWAFKSAEGDIEEPQGD